MQLSPFNLIRIALPTLCLLYTLSWGNLDAGRGYRETFGDAEHYLDVDLEVNPEGYFQKDRAEGRVFFSGFLAHGTVEEPVSGYRFVKNGRRYYQFNYGEGQFQGELKTARAGCEPILHFSVTDQGRRVKQGTLRAGFCY